MVGYRKLSAMALAVLSASILAFLGSIDSGTYQVVMVATLGGYFAANVYSKKETKNDLQQRQTTDPGH